MVTQQIEDFMQEMIDVYDKDQKRLGLTVPREGAFMQEGQYMLYVLAIIQDAQGRFLITQRSENKHWAAGWWEVTGGGVSAGENSCEAVRREVREEVGLDVSGKEPELVYTYENVDLKRGDNYIVNMYRVQLDFDLKDVVLQESEAVDARLVAWDDIVALHEEGIFLHFDRVRKAIGA